MKTIWQAPPIFPSQKGKSAGLALTGTACSFGLSFNLILQSQSNWFLFNGTWQQSSRELVNQIIFEIGETTLKMQ